MPLQQGGARRERRWAVLAGARESRRAGWLAGAAGRQQQVGSSRRAEDRPAAGRWHTAAVQAGGTGWRYRLPHQQVGALHVSVDDGRGAAVKVHEACGGIQRLHTQGEPPSPGLLATPRPCCHPRTDRQQQQRRQQRDTLRAAPPRTILRRSRHVSAAARSGRLAAACRTS